MAQHPSQFDIDCLRLIAADPDARDASLSAAMIKLHALTIARTEPALRSEALEIVRHLESLYRKVPSRTSLARVLRNSLGRIPDTMIDDAAEAIWSHLLSGRA